MKVNYFWFVFGSIVVSCVHAEILIGRRDDNPSSSSSSTETATVTSTSSTTTKTSSTKSSSSKTTTTKASTSTTKSTTKITSTSTAFNDQCIYALDYHKNTFYYGQNGQTCSYSSCSGYCGTYNEQSKCDTCASKCFDASNASNNKTCWPKYTACMNTCDPYCGGEKSNFGSCGNCIDKCSADLDACETKVGLKACSCLNKCVSSNCKKCNSSISLTSTSSSTSTAVPTTTFTTTSTLTA